MRAAPGGVVAGPAVQEYAGAGGLERRQALGHETANFVGALVFGAVATSTALIGAR